MMKFVDDLDLFDEMRNVLVPKPSFLYVLLDCYLLAEQFAQEDLSVAAFANGLYYLDLFFADQKRELDPLLLQIFRYLAYINRYRLYMLIFSFF